MNPNTMQHGGGYIDPWIIPQENGPRYMSTFFGQQINGFIPADKARVFLQSSGIPVPVLALIWSLADTDRDGKLSAPEFAIAMRLVELKLAGQELPPALPPSLFSSAVALMSTATAAPLPIASPVRPSPVPTVIPTPAPLLHPTPVTTTTTTTTLPMTTAPIPHVAPSAVALGGDEWAIPESDRNRYKYRFNELDPKRTGHLNGAVAKDEFTKFGLPINILALIWNLSDINKDGSLSVDEFCVAMHLISLVKAGQPLPSVLPLNLIPPNYRKQMVAAGALPATAIGMSHNVSATATATAPVPGVGVGATASSVPLVPSNSTSTSSTSSNDSVEDRKRENFLKGQEELERRRREVEEQERKSREAAEARRLAEEEAKRERLEKQRREEERQAQAAREKQLLRQQELEREKEELRIREQAKIIAETFFAWRTAKLDILQRQRTSLLESVSALQSKSKQLDDKITELNEKHKTVAAKLDIEKEEVSTERIDLEALEDSLQEKKLDLARKKQQLSEQEKRLLMQRENKKAILLLQTGGNSAVANPVTVASNASAIEQLKVQVSALGPELEKLRTEAESVKNSMSTKKSSLSSLNTEIEVTKDILAKEIKRKSGLEAKKKEADKKDEIRAEFNRRKKLEEEFKQKKLETQKQKQKLQEEEEAKRRKLAAEKEAAEKEAKAKSAAAKAEAEKQQREQQEKQEKQEKERAAKAAAAAAVTAKPATLGPKPTVATKPTPAPAPAPAPVAAPVPQKEVFVALFPYTSDRDDELTFNPKDVIVLLTRQDEDWWEGELNGKVGLFPSNYVRPANPEEIPAHLLSKPAAAAAVVVGAVGAVASISAEEERKRKKEEEMKKNAADLARLEEEQKKKKAEEEKKRIAEEEAAKAKKAEEERKRKEKEEQDRKKAEAEAAAAAAAKKKKEQEEAEAKRKKEQEEAAVAAAAKKKKEQEEAEAKKKKEQEEAAAAEAEAEKQRQKAKAAAAAAAIAAATPKPKNLTLDTVRAIYQYKDEQSDLAFAEGDVVTVLERGEDGWWKGVCHGKEGFFPGTYVEPINNANATTTTPTPTTTTTTTAAAAAADTSSTKTAEATSSGGTGTVYQAIYDFAGGQEDDLPFVTGDMITVTQTPTGGWWEGTLKGRTGWFPENHVALPSGANMKPVTAAPVSASGSKAAAVIGKVIKAHTAGSESEINLTVGSLVQISQRNPDGWWEGTVSSKGQKSQVGWFPSECVQVMEKKSKSETPSVPPNRAATAAAAAASTPAPPAAANSASNLNRVLSSSSSVSSDPSKAGGDDASSTVSDPASAAKVPAKVIQAYQAQNSGELTLTVGQLIKVAQSSDSMWFGTVMSKSQKVSGYFPASCVQIMQKGAGSARPVSTLLPEEERVIVKYAYQATKDDELTLRENDMIVVKNKKEDGWWEGELNGQIGLFPANYVVSAEASRKNLVFEQLDWTETVDPDVVSELSPEEIKRQKLLYELAITEEAYVQDLQVVVKLYEEPIKAKNILSAEEFETMFMNWDTLLSINEELSNALKADREKNDGFMNNTGQILHERLPKMVTPYMKFCSRQSKAMALLQNKNSPQFTQFLKKTLKDPRSGSLPLISFLLKPMQRISKYPLLLKQIVHNTPAGHPTQDSLIAAFEDSNTLLKTVNEHIRLVESEDRLQRIQETLVIGNLSEKLELVSDTHSLGPRQYLHEGTLIKHKNGKELYLFLFNDLIVMSKRRPNPALEGKVPKDQAFTYDLYRKPINLKSVSLSDDPDDQRGSHLFTIMYAEGSMQLRAESPKAKATWLSKISNAVQYYKDVERNRLETINNRQKVAHVVGTLHLVIIQAINLMGMDANGLSDPYCVIKLGGQEVRTKVIKMNLNPKWDYDDVFSVSSLDDKLKIEVYDQDEYSTDDFLGDVELNLRDFTNTDHNPVKLRRPLRRVQRGEIILQLELRQTGSH